MLRINYIFFIVIFSRGSYQTNNVNTINTTPITEICFHIHRHVTKDNFNIQSKLVYHYTVSRMEFQRDYHKNILITIKKVEILTFWIISKKKKYMHQHKKYLYFELSELFINKRIKYAFNVDFSKFIGVDLVIEENVLQDSEISFLKLINQTPNPKIPFDLQSNNDNTHKEYDSKQFIFHSIHSKSEFRSEESRIMTIFTLINNSIGLYKEQNIWFNITRMHTDIFRIKDNLKFSRETLRDCQKAGRKIVLKIDEYMDIKKRKNGGVDSLKLYERGVENYGVEHTEEEGFVNMNADENIDIFHHKIIVEKDDGLNSQIDNTTPECNNDRINEPISKPIIKKVRFK